MKKYFEQNFFWFILFLIIVNPVFAGRTPAGVRIKNSATVQYSDSSYAFSDTSVILVGTIRLARIYLEALDTLVMPGDSARFRLRIENAGNDTLRSVHAWERMQPALTGYSPLDTILPDLAPEQWDTFFISGLVDFSLPFNSYIYDTAWAEFDDPIARLFKANPDPMSSSLELITASSHDSIRVGYVDTLEFSKFAEADTVLSGGTMVFTLEVMNRGNRDAAGLIMLDSLPMGFTLSNASDGHFLTLDTLLSTDDVLYWLGDMPMNEIDSISVLGKFDSTACGDSRVNKAVLRFNEFSIDAEDTVFVICKPEIELELWAEDTLCSMGDTIVYNMRITSISEDTVSNLSLINFLPPHTLYVSGSGSYDAINRRVTWEIDDFAPGQVQTFSVSVIIRNDVTAGYYYLEDCAKLLWTFADDIHTLDEKCVACEAVIPFIHLEKQCFQRKASVGDILIYHIEVFNHSDNTTIPRIIIYDELPFGFDILEDAVYIDDQKAEILEKVGRIVKFEIDNIDVDSRVHIVYQVVVGRGALEGDGVNRAYAVASLSQAAVMVSNEAACWVEIEKSELEDKELVIGKVYYDDDGNGRQSFGEAGAKDIVLFTEDGMKIHTDTHGRFSIPQILPGKHVIRIDHSSLPENTQPALTTSRNLLDPYSQLINVPVAGISRASFALRRKGVWVEKFAYTGSDYNVNLDINPYGIVFEPNYAESGDVILTTILFDSGKFELKSEAQQQLANILETISHFYGVQIEVRGYADNTRVKPNPFFDTNEGLSKLRSQGVMNYLHARGVSNENLTYIGFGEKFSQGGDRNSDRRVDVVAILDNAGKPETPTPVSEVRVKFDISAGEPVTKVKFDFDLYGLDYMASSVTLGGVPLEDTGLGSRRFAWDIENPVFGDGLVFNIAPDPYGHYRVGPYLTMKSELTFRGGRTEKFTMQKAVLPKLTNGYVKMFIRKDLAPYKHMATLPFRHSQQIEDATLLEIGDIVIFQIRAAVEHSDAVLQILDEIPDGFKFVNHSATFADKEIKPMLSKGKFLWRIEVPAGAKILDMQYKCEVTKNMEMPDLSETVRVK